MEEQNEDDLNVDMTEIKKVLEGNQINNLKLIFLECYFRAFSMYT